MFVCLALAACGFPKPQDVGSDDAPSGGGSDAAVHDAAIDAPPDAPGPCNVLTQTGCSANQRCTYVNEGSALGEMCEPMGSAANGSACTIDQSSGIDNCMAGDVCAGKCKPVCNSQGSGSGGCGSGFTCNLYTHGAGTVGACDQMCDPLNDNDFDGPATAHTKTGTVCTAATQGCYGTPSMGPKPTTFTCATDINYAGQALHHRSACDAASGCAPGGNVFLNGCNQGYVPLMYDMTGSTQIDCIAWCKPLNCYQGNCGTGNANAIGASPHRCNTVDAVGAFGAAEECTFIWIYEMDQSANLVRSPYSDTLGVCFDHSKYQYDTNGDGTPDTVLPACSSLPTGFGQSAMTLGAADLGCEDTTHAGVPAHAPRKLLDVRFPSYVAP